MARFIEVTDRDGARQLVNLDRVENIFTDQYGAVLQFSGEPTLPTRESYEQIKERVEEATRD